MRFSRTNLRNCGLSKCPAESCHESITTSQIYPDKFAEREMMTLQVFCQANRGNECLWKGTLGELENHRSECPYVMVGCPNDCEKRVKRKDLQQHMTTECLQRKISCDYCNEAVLWNEFEQHFENCPQYLQQCNMCEKDGIKRGKMKFHLEHNCPNVKEECPFNLVGCAFEGLRSDIGKHLTDEHFHGIMVLMKIVVSYQMEVTRKDSNQIEVKSKGENESLVDKREKKIGQLESEVGALKQTVFEIFSQVNHLELQQKEMHNMILKQEIKLHQGEGNSCDGMYLWRIEDLAKCHQDAISGARTVMYSPGFYTSPRGYKLCLRINLNGLKNGDGTHVALFVHVMRGDYDEHLEWPFSKGFKLSIKDQSDVVESRHHITKKVVAEPELSAFQKPVAPFNEIGFGYPDFAPTEIINKPQYTKKNTLLVKFKITG